MGNMGGNAIERVEMQLCILWCRNVTVNLAVWIFFVWDFLRGGGL